jgi:hypothetical protein
VSIERLDKVLVGVFFLMLHIRTNSLNSKVICISELCVSHIIYGPFVKLDVQGKQVLPLFLPV